MKVDDSDKIYKTAFEVINRRFSKNEKISDDQINEIVEGTINLYQLKKFGFKDTIVKQLSEAISVRSSSTSIITNDEGHVDWYDNAKNRPYWDTYRDYLTLDQKYSVSGVNDIDITTDQIMSRIEDPSREGS